MVLLDAHAAKRCPRRVHLEHDPTLERVPWTPPEALQAHFDAGVEFERQVLAELAEALGPRLVWVESTAETLAAMAAGAELIAGARLPEDHAGGRTGRPDLLVRAASGYLPVEIKRHLMLNPGPRGEAILSELGAPAEAAPRPGWAVRKGPRIEDYLQLAHYRRMLAACGHGADSDLAAVIGTDLVEGRHVLTWLELDKPWFTTFSRSSGTAKRTALERYDHEHAFRLKVAETAARGEPALVVPIWQPECGTCPCMQQCESVLGAEAASLDLGGRLDRREWLALDALGVSTTSALAEVDVDAEEIATGYLPEVSHQRNARARLADAVLRAQMIRDGETLRRTTAGPIEVPDAATVVDFDLENDPDGRVYLWGAQVREGERVDYHAFVEWGELDAAAEEALARRFLDWLLTLGEHTLLVHYTAVELTALGRILGEDAVAHIRDRCLDLHALIADHFIGVHGLGLKQVARAYGFEWRDHDAGGLQSQGWLGAARSGDAEARARLLNYNADDVRATDVVRRAL